MWKAFQEEYDMTEVTFDQRTMGAKGSLPTTLGTNVYYLQGLQGEGVGEQEYEEAKDHSGTWSTGFTKGSCNGPRSPITIPRLCSMTPAQWKRHVDSNHLDYNRECLTCVLARGTGRRHARVQSSRNVFLDRGHSWTSQSRSRLHIQGHTRKRTSLSSGGKIHLLRSS